MDIGELLKFSTPKSLLVITWNNILKQLFCPFKAKVMRDIGSLKAGQIVWVEQIKVTQELKTVFIIDGQAYYYYHLDIIVDDHK